MSVGNLATALTIIFAVSIIVLLAELLYVLWRRRFFRLKSQTRVEVEPSEAPTQKPDGSSPEDPVIDVFKLLEANGPSRVLCTIKEEDREDVESISVSRVDSVEITAAERVSLQACLEFEAAAEFALRIDQDTKSVFSSPCDSPVFILRWDLRREMVRFRSLFVYPVTGNDGPAKGSYVG